MARRRAKMEMDRLPGGPWGRYWAATHAPLNCLLFILPFILVYEIGVEIWGTDLMARRQLQSFLHQFGATASHLSAVLVAVVLLAWQAAGRRRWRVSGSAIGLMVVESLLLSLPLLGMGVISGRMSEASALSPAGAGGLATDLLAGVGAGIYEEFLFRLVAMNLLGLVLLDLVGLQEDLGQILAVLATATLFALYHPQVHNPWQWGTFAYLFIAGCYLALIYMGRGFGIAVGTHVSYNLIVRLLQAMA